MSLRTGTTELKFFKQPPVIVNHLALTAIAQIDGLLSSLETFGRKYKGAEYAEAMEDARKQVEVVRISTLKAILK